MKKIVTLTTALAISFLSFSTSASILIKGPDGTITDPSTQVCNYLPEKQAQVLDKGVYCITLNPGETQEQGWKRWADELNQAVAEAEAKAQAQSEAAKKDNWFVRIWRQVTNTFS